MIRFGGLPHTLAHIEMVMMAYSENPNHNLPSVVVVSHDYDTTTSLKKKSFSLRRGGKLHPESEQRKLQINLKANRITTDPKSIIQQ